MSVKRELVEREQEGLNWCERFKRLDRQEMLFDIQMIECHLPDPWYRMPMCWVITVLLFGGFGLLFLAALCATTHGPVIALFVIGCIMPFAGLGLMAKYDSWFDDPCSIIIDKKMYREDEELKAPFKSHSQVNDHTDYERIKLEVKAMIEEEEEKSRQAEIAEAYRFAALSEEEKIREKLREVEIQIAEAIAADHSSNVQAFFMGKGEDARLKPLGMINEQDMKDMAYDKLAGEGWIPA